MRALNVLVLVAALSLAGCGGEECAPAPVAAPAASLSAPPSLAVGRLLWNRDGCAYYVRPGFGGNVLLYRVPDADRTSCPPARRRP